MLAFQAQAMKLTFFNANPYNQSVCWVYSNNNTNSSHKFYVGPQDFRTDDTVTGFTEGTVYVDVRAPVNGVCGSGSDSLVGGFKIYSGGDAFIGYGPPGSGNASHPFVIKEVSMSATTWTLHVGHLAANFSSCNYRNVSGAGKNISDLELGASDTSVSRAAVPSGGSYFEGTFTCDGVDFPYNRNNLEDNNCEQAFWILAAGIKDQPEESYTRPETLVVGFDTNDCAQAGGAIRAAVWPAFAAAAAAYFRA